jgi:transposase InsO family protein
LQIIKIIDQGGEFTSNEFKEFFTLHGINMEVTTTYTPQQNGLVERKNRTIVGMAICMLNKIKKSNMHCEYAFHTTTYIINKIEKTY